MTNKPEGVLTRTHWQSSSFPKDEIISLRIYTVTQGTTNTPQSTSFHLVCLSSFNNNHTLSSTCPNKAWIFSIPHLYKWTILCQKPALPSLEEMFARGMAMVFLKVILWCWSWVNLVIVGQAIYGTLNQKYYQICWQDGIIFSDEAGHIVLELRRTQSLLIANQFTNNQYVNQPVNQQASLWYDRGPAPCETSIIDFMTNPGYFLNEFSLVCLVYQDSFTASWSN